MLNPTFAIAWVAVARSTVTETGFAVRASIVMVCAWSALTSGWTSWVNSGCCWSPPNSAEPRTYRPFGSRSVTVPLGSNWSKNAGWSTLNRNESYCVAGWPVLSMCTSVTS